MELMLRFKLGSVWLLLSCSLQQSLWGILASVPKTQAERCQVSSDGEPVKKVQMIRRIPARCSGWDEAWSWISNVDCRTKYVYDFVELPSAVQKVDVKDCKEDNDAEAKTSSWPFNVSNEKFLAIVLGSATVALLVLIGLIVLILLFWRGHARCSACSNGPSYTSANVSEQETQETRPGCNDYTLESCKHVEPVYEECRDPNTVKQRLGCCDDTSHQKSSRYQNIPELSSADEKSAAEINDGFKNSSHLPPPNSPPVIPSAPYEEDLQQTERKCVLNEYNSFDAAIAKQHHVRTSTPDCESVKPANGNGRLAASPMMSLLKEANDAEAGIGNDISGEVNSESVVQTEMDNSDTMVCKGQNGVDSCNTSGENCNNKLQDGKKESDAKLTPEVASVNVYHNFEDLVQDVGNCSTNATQDSIMSPVQCERDECILKSVAMATEPVYENDDTEPDVASALQSSSRPDGMQPMVLATREPQTVTLHSLAENSTIENGNKMCEVQSVEESLT